LTTAVGISRHIDHTNDTKMQSIYKGKRLSVLDDTT
jgi:hypothetical protein